MNNNSESEDLTKFTWVLSPNGLSILEFKAEVFDKFYGNEARPSHGTFVPDIRPGLVEEDFPDYAESVKDVIDMDLNSSPNETDLDFIQVPFTPEKRAHIKSTFRRSLGRVLITESMATRELFALQTKHELAKTMNSSKVSARGQSTSTYVVLIVLGFFLVSVLSSGFKNNEIGQALFTSALLLISFGIYMGIKWKRKRSALQVGLVDSSGDSNFQSETLRELEAFFTRNPWYRDALNAYVALVDSKSESFIRREEARIKKLRSK